ncbi:MAG: bifunctional 4-hydroxy-2-oxoglutarate aldolase/2-dehydro-3-deoxy-phosphogluconate aldolase [Ruminococcus sp.]|nr:bifunctional 4-hydroxy-2-oxoglutarate aldolase/2-dehydro-3-deoxy-phosphogluconate aldolase [Ruminococcus sp.]
MDKTVEQLERTGIIPVVVLDDAKDALPLAKALCEGGLPAAEITFRTAAARESIAVIASECPDMVVGAGTVLTCKQADEAFAAGAKFIVAPGLNPEVVGHCRELGVPMLPGCSSATDIEAALALGLTEVKFFPAEQLGGLRMIKALAAPYTGVRFMPTGGLNAGNIAPYLEERCIIACGGSFMVSRELIAGGEFERIRSMSEKASSLMCRMTFKETAPDGKAVFTCPSPMRTVFQLERRGVRFIPGTEVFRDGRLVSAETGTMRITAV